MADHDASWTGRLQFLHCGMGVGFQSVQAATKMDRITIYLARNEHVQHTKNGKLFL
jgi:hypothetical protein